MKSNEVYIKMNYLSKSKEYNYIINNIINNKEFLKIDNCRHHGITRLEHSLRVSYYSYRVSKAIGLDVRQTTRAALLHDFFVTENLNHKEQCLSAFYHPKKALANADEYFILTDKEKDIIYSHMFPLIPSRPPKYLESWVVCLVDKIVATYEFASSYGKSFLFKIENVMFIMAFFIGRIL